MRKITLIAALLGTAYFANAQVGIGTPTPADATMLHINANNKGVIIPNVPLTSTTDVATVEGTEVESLLVYNTATAGDVTPGFYYWVKATTTPAVAAHWERIVNQAQLDDAIGDITDLQGDLSKIIALLKVVFPANNLVDPTVTGDTHGGGMVFTPGTNPTIEYVYFDGTNYVKKDITADIKSMIKGAETKTKIVTIGNVPYYVSESYTGTTDPTTGTEPGVYKIDVIGSIVNNFNNFINSTVTGGGTNYNTVEEYIEYISKNSMQNGITRIVFDTTVTPNQASFEQWNATTKTWTPVANTAFANIVKANETETEIKKNTTGTAVAGDVEITYDYFNETSGSTAQATIDLTTDIQNLIEGNTDIQNAITNILNKGGNVYYGDHDNNPATPNVFYTIIAGVKTPIDISSVVVNAITNATTVQKQEIKNQLGDTYVNNDVVNTGDTWIDGGKVYKGVFAATVTAKTANVSNITLKVPTGTTAIGDVIGIKILNAATNQIVNTATTDVAVTAGVLTFKIGTGNMYSVLKEAATADFDIKVIVEYSAQ